MHFRQRAIAYVTALVVTLISLPASRVATSETFVDREAASDPVPQPTPAPTPAPVSTLLHPNAKTTGLPIDPDNCLQYLTPEMSQLLAVSNQYMIEVERGVITPQKAGSEMHYRIQANAAANPTSEALMEVLVAAQVEAARSNRNLFLIDRIARGDTLDDGDKKWLLDPFQELNIPNPEADLNLVVAETKPHLALMKSMGASLDEHGWNLTHFQWATLKSNYDLQKSYTVFFPEAQAGLSQWAHPVSTKPIYQVINLGPYLALPGGQVWSVQYYVKILGDWTRILRESFEEYAYRLQESSSAYDLLLQARGARKWDDFITPAQAASEGVYSRIINVIDVLERHLGFDPRKIVKFRKVILSGLLEKEAEAVSDSLATLANLKVFIIGVVALFAVAAVVAVAFAVAAIVAPVTMLIGNSVLYTVLPLWSGFTSGFGILTAATAINAELEKWQRGGGSYFCWLVKKMTEDAPSNAKWAAIFAPVGYLRVGIVKALGGRWKMTEEAASGLTKGLLKYLAIGGGAWGFSTSALHALRDHMGAKQAQDEHNDDLVRVLRAQESQNIAQAVEAVLLSFLAYRIKAPPKMTEAQSTASLKEFDEMAAQPVSHFINAEQFATAAQRYVESSQGKPKLYDAEFAKWLKQNIRRAEFNPKKLPPGTTLSQALEPLERDWFLQTQSGSWLARNARYFKSPVRLAFSAIKRTKEVFIAGLIGLLRTVKDGAVLAPILRVSGAYEDGPVSPIDSFARVMGNEQLSMLTKFNKDWIYDFTNYHGDFETYRATFLSLLYENRNNSTKFMTIMKYMGSQFTNYNSHVGGEQQNGQNILIGGLNDLNGYTNNLVNNIAIVYSARDRIENIEAKIADKKNTTPLTDHEKRDLVDYTKLRNDTLKVIASDVALYKVRLALFQSNVLNGAVGQKDVEDIFESIIANQDIASDFEIYCEKDVAEILGNYKAAVYEKDKQVAADVIKQFPELKKAIEETNRSSP